jgi:hypothetical protein
MALVCLGDAICLEVLRCHSCWCLPTKQKLRAKCFSGNIVRINLNYCFYFCFSTLCMPNRMTLNQIKHRLAEGLILPTLVYILATR